MPHHVPTETPSFDSILRSRLAPVRPRALGEGECMSAEGVRCTLCAGSLLAYEDEAAIKEEALRTFWAALDLPVTPAPLQRAPAGRGYRTVSKRKAFHARDGSVRLGLIADADTGHGPAMEAVRCMIEPPAHGAVYQTVRDAIRKPFARPLAEQLGYVVLRQAEEELAVILSVRAFSPPLIKAANTLSRGLTRAHPAIVGLFLYEDPSGGRYYLGSRDPGARPRVQKLFGRNTLALTMLGRRFHFSPLSFSQVNETMTTPMVTTASRLLGLPGDVTLFDLYCGYGVFGLCLSGQVHNVVGVELSPGSVESARGNAEHQKAGNVRFVRNDITASSLPAVLGRPQRAPVVLLDPPRNGTAPGVIEVLAARRPERVVHLVCAIDRLWQELARWSAAGYAAHEIIPFDMFPGTSAIETMVLLRPAAQG